MVAREEEFGDEDTRRGMQQRRVICGFGFVTNRHAGIFSDTGCAKWTKTNGRVARRTWLTTNGLIADVGFFFTKRFDRHRFLVLTNRYPEEMRIILSLSRFFQIAGETMKNSNDLGSTIEEMSKYDVFSLSLESICTISSLFFSLFRISRDPRIRMAVWNRGYEDTIRDRQDRKISRVSFFSAVATSDREFVHGHVHLSARDLQFNATASSRNASTLSDEEDTNPTAQKKRLSLPRYFLLLARLPPRVPLDIIPIRQRFY